ncbi:hypothetical protein vfu_A01472 [Vibrio furnissii NCTC 11218]|nr:hypothetical protein vfu_A01472 [Vibrio furnissii NCTC 11218]
MALKSSRLIHFPLLSRLNITLLRESPLDNKTKRC